MKMLYILNVANRINSFCMSSIIAAKNLGIEYHIAGNWSYKDENDRINDEKKYGIRIHQVDFIRSPLNINNRKAYKQLDKIVSQEKFDVIHCNTPIGGLLGRIVAKKHKISNVIYQAHGFHFYKGAPKLNWLIYYPIEKLLAKYTDTLITINQEDFELAKAKFRLRNNGQVHYVAGVGMDLETVKSVNADRKEKRKSLGFTENDTVLISAGRLDANKNNETTIRAVSKVPDIKLILCGDGELKNGLSNLVKELNIEDRVLFLGNRSDIFELYESADIFIMLSFREGLSRSILEAMAFGLPCIASNIRGNADLIEDGIGGYLVPATDVDLISKKIQDLADNKSAREQMSNSNKKNIVNFSLDVAVSQIQHIYENVNIESKVRG